MGDTSTVQRDKPVKGLSVVGFDRLNLVDYPGRLCASVTVPGCNFRCPFCTKRALIHDFIPMPKTPEDKIIETLHPRIGFLDGVCLTGGEPLIHREVFGFLDRLKSIGAQVKMDTNGSYPKRLRLLIIKRVLQYIAMEVVAPPRRYTAVTGYGITPKEILESIQYVRRSSLDYEFRTTMVPGFVEEQDLKEIVATLSGSKRLILRNFKPGDTVSEECRSIQPYSEPEMRQFLDLAAPYFGEVRLEN